MHGIFQVDTFQPTNQPTNQIRSKNLLPKKKLPPREVLDTLRMSFLLSVVQVSEIRGVYHGKITMKFTTRMSRDGSEDQRLGSNSGLYTEYTLFISRL